ncbi:MAG: type II toxin-antitoxin system Phd/YefM family antitoxin [Anaerolineaceae bacterium]|nr:type II toxin-antitoxin system Phd/YefM family antitoxin [Anaerolineaceae bacterium]
MPQIIPIKELKDTNHIFEMCRNTNEPIFITKNGFGEMVLMSMDAYDEMFKKLEIFKELAISEQQFVAGAYLDAKTALTDIRAKYGL